MWQVLQCLFYIFLISFHTKVSSFKGSWEHEAPKKETRDVSVQEVYGGEYLKPITFEPTLPPKPEMSGPLYNFIINICDAILEDFSNSRIPKYIKILGKRLKGLGSGVLMKMMIRRFAKGLNILSDYRGQLIKGKVENFLKIISQNKPKRKDLFKSLNSLYTLRQDIKMDDYIYRLKQYGRKRKRHIVKFTRDILNLIFYTISKQDDVVKRDLFLKFNLAITEYIDETRFKVYVVNSTGGNPMSRHGVSTFK